jgi:hypothetical protein
MSEKDFKKLEDRIGELQKEVDLLKRVKELETEVRKLKDYTPITIPYVPYVPPYSPWYPRIWYSGTTGEIDSTATYTYKAQPGDQVSLTGGN